MVNAGDVFTVAGVYQVKSPYRLHQNLQQFIVGGNCYWSTSLMYLTLITGGGIKNIPAVASKITTLVGATGASNGRKA